MCLLEPRNWLTPSFGDTRAKVVKISQSSQNKKQDEMMNITLILENFITIIYDFEKHVSWVVLLYRSQFLPQKFICLRERDETF